MSVRGPHHCHDDQKFYPSEGRRGDKQVIAMDRSYWLSGVVEDGVQWSEGDSWPIGERAEGAGTVGDVERER